MRCETREGRRICLVPYIHQESSSITYMRRASITRSYRESRPFSASQFRIRLNQKKVCRRTVHRSRIELFVSYPFCSTNPHISDHLHVQWCSWNPLCLDYQASPFSFPSCQYLIDSRLQWVLNLKKTLTTEQPPTITISS